MKSLQEKANMRSQLAKDAGRSCLCTAGIVCFICLTHETDKKSQSLNYPAKTEPR